MIVCSDHSQSRVDDEIDVFRAFDGFGVLPAARARSDDAEIALCPNSRAAQVYVLDRDNRASSCRGSSARCWRSRASTSCCG